MRQGARLHDRHACDEHSHHECSLYGHRVVLSRVHSLRHGYEDDWCVYCNS